MKVTSTFYQQGGYELILLASTLQLDQHLHQDLQDMHRIFIHH